MARTVTQSAYTLSPETHMRALEAAKYLLWYKDKGGNTDHCKEAWDTLRSALATEGKG